MTGASVLSICAISKAFAGTRALVNVDLEIAPAEIHALVGENGAGKSTLIKLASGALAPDAGEVRVSGAAMTGSSRASFRDAGVRVIYQERQIAPELTVGENVVLDRPPGSRFAVSWKRINSEAAERLAVIGSDLDPRQGTAQLSVAQWQQIELARAVDFGARLVIMDEPTASLGRSEVERLFDVVERLKNRGVAILYISHHLDEVFRLADKVTVLRDGHRVFHGDVGPLTPPDLVEHMFGAVEHNVTRSAVAADRPVAIELDDVHLSGSDRGISMLIRSGEVVGFTGGLGSGVSELASVLVGARRPDAGCVRLGGGRRITRRARAARSVAYLPSDRKRRGLMMDRSIADNLTLAELAVEGPALISPGRRRARAERLMHRAGVKSDSVERSVQTLSGGNQQKVVIGRWIDRGSSVLVVDEPTAGIDIPSKMDIYRTLRHLAAQGAAIVVCSTDFQEIGLVADRVFVLRDGRIVGQTDGADATEQHLIELEMRAS